LTEEIVDTDMIGFPHELIAAVVTFGAREDLIRAVVF
jgi:hypothetical protein